MELANKRMCWALIAAVAAICLVIACLTWSRRSTGLQETELSTHVNSDRKGQPANSNSRLGEGQGGSVVAVESRKGRAYFNQRSYFAPAGDVEDVARRLTLLAEAGDAEAAFLLYLKFEECRRALEDGVSQAELRLYSDAKAVQNRLNAEARTLDGCANYSKIKEPRAGYWLEQSADAGYLIAQLMYASDSRAVLGSRADMLRSPEDTIRYRRKAIAYLERAANTGNVDALISLGKSYQSGIIAKEDLVKAYSYFYAAGMVNPNFTRNYIGRLERKLTREQMEQAKQRGVQIFNGCCK